MKEFFLAISDYTVGPLKADDIIQGLRRGQISLFDQIYNQQLGEWVMLMQHPDFSDIEAAELNSDKTESHKITKITAVEENTFTSPAIAVNVMSRDIPEIEPVTWYIQDMPGSSYKYLQVLSLIKNKKLTEQSLIAQYPQGPFRALMHWADFSEENREQFKQSTNIHIPDLHLRRRHERKPCAQNFLFLSQGKLYKAFCSDISKHGLAVLVRTELFQNHEELVIKFQDVFADRKFDAKAIVVTARKVRIAGHEEAFIRYGIRFTHLTSSGREFIARLDDEGTQTKAAS